MGTDRDTRLRTSVAEELGSDADLLRELARPPAPTLSPGTVVADQFEIETLLGRGGMGAVYQARDRALGRRVALKLGLHHTDVSTLEREASTLARLAHPNVVTIYEIGTHEGVPFVVMELCSGGTLRGWLNTTQPPPSWRLIVERFVAAGRGLAAAHAAGIVHGDVKPDNILLGDDERPRIADFGLARVAVDDQPGSRAGTPRYMAPELARSAASDQFAFAVALYEALAGEPPFPAEPTARAAAIEHARLPPLQGVPRPITAALARAMRADPARRWPDLATLLAQLEPPRPRARSPWLLLAIVAIVVAIVAAIALRTSPPDDEHLAVQPTKCEGLPVDLASDWSDDTRARTRTAHPRAAGAASLLADVLDHVASEWTRARRRLCKELPTLPSWSPALGDAGRTCLISRRAELRRLVTLRDLDASTLIGHLHTVLLPASCADPARLEPKTLEPAVADVRAQADAIAILRDEGDTTTALARARALVASLPPDAPPLAAGAANALLGELLLAHTGLADSAPPTRTAFFAYRVAGSPQAFEPALRLVEAYTQAGEVALAEEWLAHARAEASRITLSAVNRAALELITARLHAQRGDHAAAVAEARRALATVDASKDPRRLLMKLSILSSNAVFLADLGDLAASVDTARDVLAHRERLYGPTHPILITDLFNIGLGELDLARPDDALATLRRAREIAEAHLPADATLRAYALWNEGLAIGRIDRRAARTSFDRALDILVASSGADSPDAVELRADRTRWSAP